MSGGEGRAGAIAPRATARATRWIAPLPALRAEAHTAAGARRPGGGSAARPGDPAAGRARRIAAIARSPGEAP